MKLTTASMFKSILLPIFFTILGAVAVLVYPFALSAPDVTIEVFDMQYACGDCYVQYRVLRAAKVGEKLISQSQRSFDNEETTPVRFVGWDILVFYKGDDESLNRYLNEHIDTSGECMQPIFRLSGQLKRRLIYSLIYRGDMYDGIYFDAHTAVAVNRYSRSCKRPAGETPL